MVVQGVAGVVGAGLQWEQLVLGNGAQAGGAAEQDAGKGAGLDAGKGAWLDAGQGAEQGPRRGNGGLAGWLGAPW